MLHRDGLTDGRMVLPLDSYSTELFAGEWNDFETGARVAPEQFVCEQHVALEIPRACAGVLPWKKGLGVSGRGPGLCVFVCLHLFGTLGFDL